MQVRNTTRRWGAVSKLLHWAIVALVITQFVLANLAGNLPLGMAKLGMLARHKSVGITVLALALLRLLWRSTQPAPALPAGMPTPQRWLAQGTHLLLYLLLLAMPLSGWLMSSAKNYPVSWFGLLQLPDLVAPGEATFTAMRNAHEAMAALLALTALLHLLGALKHHFFDRDDVLRRMLPFVRGVAPLLAALGVALVGGTAVGVTFAAATAAAPASTPQVVPTIRYVLDPARSTLEFRFRQAGATATGRFTRFRVTLDWPATGAAPGKAALEVEIDTASLDTADADRDGTLRGADLFAVQRFPQARFTANGFGARAGAGAVASAGTGEPLTLTAQGTLLIRDRSRALAVPLTVRFATESGQRVAFLRGEAPLKRLEFGVGQGEWQSTQWVDDAVTVHWDLRLQERPRP